jgi:hypothetical protein
MNKEDVIKKIIENKESHVYFMQKGDDGPIKIGITKRIRHRLGVIQVDNPCLIYLLAIFPGGRTEELSLHKRFSEFNIVGEWFEPCEELLEFIKQYPEIKLTSIDFQSKRKRGKENHNWKGEDAGKSSKQQRARAYKRYKTDYCERCKTGRGLDVHYKDGNKDNLCEENIAYYCRRCRMEVDGTLEGLKNAKKPEILPPKPCSICGKLTKELRNGRCHNCSEYFRRHGIERSEMKTGPNDPVACIVCGKLVQQPAKGKCHTCYEFFRRNGFERKDAIIKDVETDDIEKLKLMSVLMDNEKATFIRKLYKTKLYTVKFIAKQANISIVYCYDVIRNICYKDENYIYIPNTCSNKVVLNGQSEDNEDQKDLDGYNKLEV